MKLKENKNIFFYHHITGLSDMIVVRTSEPVKMKSLTYWKHQTGENYTYNSTRSILVNPTTHHLLRWYSKHRTDKQRQRQYFPFTLIELHLSKFSVRADLTTACIRIRLDSPVSPCSVLCVIQADLQLHQFWLISTIIPCDNPTLQHMPLCFTLYSTWQWT